MSTLKLYKSYSFTDKDPIIDRLRTAVADAGWTWTRLSVESGVSRHCIAEWFDGKTKRPAHATIAAAFSALGFDLLPVARGSARIVPLRALPAPRNAKAD